MRISGPIHALRPSATRRLAGDAKRAFVASGAIAGICAVAAVFAGIAHSSIDRGAGAQAQSAADLSIGSVLVVSPSGTFCRNQTIDNRTWQIHDKGWMDCEDALAKSGGAENRETRIDRIRQSFRGNQ